MTTLEHANASAGGSTTEPGTIYAGAPFALLVTAPTLDLAKRAVEGARRIATAPVVRDGLKDGHARVSLTGRASRTIASESLVTYARGIGATSAVVHRFDDLTGALRRGILGTGMRLDSAEVQTLHNVAASFAGTVTYRLLEAGQDIKDNVEAKIRDIAPPLAAVGAGVVLLYVGAALVALALLRGAR